MLNPKDYALALIASSRNNFAGNKSFSDRISNLCNEIKNLNHSAKSEAVYSLLAEALEVKQLPLTEKNEKLDRFAKIYALNQQKIDLFCFPYAGGMANFYKEWSNFLPKIISVKPIEYPGRGTKSKQLCLQRLCQLLDVLEKEITPKIQGPFAFFGHSLGSIVSYELAKRLKMTISRIPICLFLSACPPPRKVMSITSINRLDDSHFIKEVESLNGIPRELVSDPEFLTSFLPIIRADFGLLDDYQPDLKDKIDSPITVFGGEQDPFVNAEDLQSWSNETTGSTSMHVFPGDHFYLRSPQDLLKNITAQIQNYASK